MADYVLAWDAPNIDMTLSGLLGHRPGQPERPEMRALLRWLASERQETVATLEATVFVNVPVEHPQALQGWITFLTSVGFRVFAKPRQEGTDIDEEMVAYIQKAAADGACQVVIGSNDAKRFLEPARELVAAGVTVVVLGFTEFAGDLAEVDGWTFIDLEDIPDLLRAALPRTRLDQLPTEGGWFEPKVDPAATLSEDETDEPSPT
jgi:uncharacterized protein